MLAGDILDDRFAIDRAVGKGGMGTVFYATDRVENRPVAVKVLNHGGSAALDRFRREVRVLSELGHPAIVRYIAHGETPEHEPFLVMEWLAGEDLARRLESGELAPEDAIVVARRVADALAHAHARGVVHRDVKPSNVFLVDRDPRRVVLLDFGIARVAETRAWTKTGMILGTVGYMAPEQALAEGVTDARADLFALGCVLFECLTGKPAFGGPHELAVLAKLLSGETPRLSDHRPELGHELEALVAGMLAHDPADRPDGAGIVRDALDGLKLGGALAATEIAAFVPGGDPGSRRVSHRGLTGGERRVRSVLIAEPWPHDGGGSTITPEALVAERETLDALARRFGAERTWLPGGRILLAFGGARSASDLAAFAATCALELRARAPAAKVAVATGTAEAGGDVALGPVIDRLALLLGSVDEGRIAIDDVTAGLLPGYFLVEELGALRHLIRAVTLDEEPRPLMGRRTRCVGRERELGQLALFLDECASEPVARAVVVVGDPGMGKTRLRQEFVARARQRHAGLTVVFGRGEKVTSGSPVTVARQLARSGLGLPESGDPVDASRQIRAAVERVLGSSPVDERLRMGDFLGELVGVTHPDEPCFQLQAGRDDPRLMHDWIRRTFVAWLGALCRATPVLVVLDDLHWADAATVAWLDEALRSLRDLPLLVLGLGRPELRDLHRAFPEQQEIPLAELKRKAAEDLVRSALPSLSDADVARLIEQSGGNAFYLEELTRHFASGATDLPPTVLAMAQARLEDIDVEARVVLRAASVFGERFWLEGVEAILGDRARDASRWFELLAADELVAMRGESRFAGAREYVFRHALVREAAYASFPESDRQAAHLGAAAWLEGVGESNPFVMIDHFEKAGRARLAVRWYAGAAEGAVSSADLLGSEALARRGLATYAPGEPRDGALLVILGGTLMHQSKPAEGREIALEGLETVPQGSPRWVAGVAGVVSASTMLGDALTPMPWLARLASLSEELVPSADLGACLHIAYLAFAYAGQPALAEAAIAQFDRALRGVARSPMFEGWRGVQRALRADLDPEHVAEGYGEARESLRIFEFLERSVDSADGGGASGVVLGLGLARLFVSRHASFLGKLDVARDQVSSVGATPIMQQMLADPAVRAAVATGDLAAAETLAAPVLRGASAYTEIHVRTLLTLAYADAGRHAEAARTIDEVTPAIEVLLGLRVNVHMARSRVALARGDAEGALVECDLGDDAARQWGGLVHSRQLLVLTRAEALLRLGRTDEAKRTLAALRAQVDAIASKLDQPARESYLARGFPAARIVRAARDWLGK